MSNIFSSVFSKTNAENSKSAISKASSVIDPPMVLKASMEVPTTKMSYENISGAILRLRSNTLIGKGRLTVDQHLADHLYAAVCHYYPDANVSYETIEEAIAFVKNNPIMGAGKWTKDEHLAEYIYATIRLSAKANAQKAATVRPTPVAAISVKEEAVQAEAKASLF